MTTFEHWRHLMVMTLLVILGWIGMAAGFVFIPVLMGWRDAEIRLDRYFDRVEQETKRMAGR